MLNDNLVLSYIKKNLAFPYNKIEVPDTEILEYVKEFTIKEFSYYSPNIKTIGYNTQLPQNKVPNKGNEFYIVDDEGLEILNIVDIYFGQSNLFFHGHPPIGAMSIGELSQWALSVEVSMMVKQFSNWNYTFRFFHPNIVRISPVPTDHYIAIEYETIQPIDFSGIRNEFQRLFLELALSDIMILIGRIRKKYGDTLKTPYGDIPINSDIFDEGKTKRDEVIQKLEKNNMVNIVIDVG